MDFNLTSKNNIGIVGTLILAVFLSQSRTMDFMFRTALGRLTLIILILAMSYTSKILGVVGVLFVVIICCSSKMNFMEGATIMDNINSDKTTGTPSFTISAPRLTTSPGVTTTTNTTTSSDPTTTDPTTTDPTTTDPTTTDPTTTNPTTTEPATTEPTSTAVQSKKKAISSAIGTILEEAQKGVTDQNTNTNVTDQTNDTDVTTEQSAFTLNTENAGVESFDILGLERNIQKGKNSNTIPIHNNNNYNNILPTDFGRGFNIGFSIF
jgi:hypothetical protein